MLTPYQVKKAENILQEIKKGNPFSELPKDDRLLVARYCYEKGAKSITALQKELDVTYVTAEKYYHVVKTLLRDAEGTTIDEQIFGLEIWEKFLAIYDEAMKAGKLQVAVQALTSLVSTLQSMGLIYKAPSRKQVQAAIQQHNIHTKQQVGTYTKFKNAIKGKEKDYEVILHELMEAVDKDKIPKVPKSKDPVLTINQAQTEASGADLKVYGEDDGEEEEKVLDIK
ncbi:hypothetical protein [Thermoanaerobacter sp. A7A]|uniref:hypothetical protein n=1 Tax=Thermoanaerobacter sp. A7A TaxID=1350366 RepID=UPI00041D091D|nr:hypothetical protein [Thermoanaerobacter sp. A7A]